MKVKICGQTSFADCEMSVKRGTDFLGVVIGVEWSPRSLDKNRALPIFEAFRDRTFMLTFNRAINDSYLDEIKILDPYALQLTGQEPPEAVSDLKKHVGRLIYKSVHLSPEGEGDEGDVSKTVVESIHIYADAGADGIVLDTACKNMYGGTGKKSNWEVAAKIVGLSPLPVFLAGGINPDNVIEAVKTPGIYGIDLASGVESSKGKKSALKLDALFEKIGSVS
ncbi:Phosphoribosylanthranilate isomerase [hydrothermal vent metagenome]|uniref:phosphoribosylanthranilate isomerase n=1 Tax=hydrothermal vent metagenome TaxID=652676 RepID=A0A3B1CGH5_9ZZZZ